MKRTTTSYVVSIGAPIGNYDPGPRRFGFVINSAAIPKVVTTSDEGKARTIEIR